MIKDFFLFDVSVIEKASKLFTRPCRFMLSVVDSSQLPPADLPEVAFVGRSNVGKSMLLNTLFNQRDLAKTSSTPGRTQQLNYFNLDGLLYMVDLPGYGFAKAPNYLVKEWNQFNFEYLRGRPNLRRVFLMVDSRHGLKKIDQSIMDMLDEAAVCYQIVLTKTDKISGKELNNLVEQTQFIIKDHPAAHQRILSTSSTKRIGIKNLQAEIFNLLEE